MTEQKIVICRLCLAAHDNLNFINSIQTDMLQIVVPKMDVNISLFDMICNVCAKTLNQIFTFKSIVLEIDNNLHNYTNNGQQQANLEDILEVQMIDVMCESKIKIRRVCRTCLGHLKDNSFTELSESNYDQWMILQTCLPEMNIQMTKHPVVCPTCVNTLENMFNFIVLCMEHENKIKHYLKTLLPLDSRESQNGVTLDIVSNGDIIVVSDDESSGKKYNTRESNSKIANTKRTEDGTDEVDDDVADPDYEIDKDSSEYDSDFDEEKTQNVKKMRPQKRRNGVKWDIIKSGDILVSGDERFTKKFKTTESNSKIVNTKTTRDRTDEIDEGPNYEMDKESSEYDNDLDEGVLSRVKKDEKKERINECSDSRRNVHGSLAKRDSRILKRRKVQMREVHVKVAEEKGLNIAKNASKELRATKAEIMEPIEEVEDIELITSIEENSVTLRVKRGPITYANGIEEERENNKSLVPREKNDLVLNNRSNTYMTNQSPIPGDFVEIMILKCQLCGFNTRSLLKIKDHLISHSFNSYFAQYNIAGYKEIFCCGKCIRYFHDNVSLRDHDCVNNTKVNVPQFKVGGVSYCMRCFFETDKEDVFLSHLKQCIDH